MSTSVVTKHDFNDAFERRFDPTSPFVYKTVFVLLLYWQEADYDFKSEADRLELLFGEKFHYDVERFAIPSEDSATALNDEIYRVRRQYSKPNSLIIIHYGGHGDKDDERKDEDVSSPRKSVWAAKTNITNTDILDWSYIQPQLKFGKGDFLVILDCCFGAQAARASSDHVIPSNVELLAAAPMGQSVPAPGIDSFTTAFIDEVELALDRQGYAEISDLHHRLASRDRDLMQTPQHFCHRTQTTIRLQPHTQGAEVMSLSGFGTTLTMEMIFRSPLDQRILARVLRWLSNSVPHEVSGLKVTNLIHKAKAAEDLVNAMDSDKGMAQDQLRSALHLSALPEDSKVEMRSAWSNFNWSLVQSLKSIVSLDNTSDYWNANQNMKVESDPKDEETKIRQFLQDFDSNVTLLASAIERNVLSIPEILEANVDTAAQYPAAVKDLNLVQSLQKKMENILFKAALDKNASFKKDLFSDTYSANNHPKAGSLVEDYHPKFGRVLIEYSYYPVRDEKMNDAMWESVQEKNGARMEHLVKLLRGPNSGFNTPSCVSWTSTTEKTRYGLIFKHPHDKPYRAVSLYDVLGPPPCNSPPFPRPTLGQRFLIAQKIGQALLKWHSVGWLHESISSLNVLFFQNQTSNTIDYSEPLLYGFSFSRYTGHYSTPCQGKDDIIRNVYQHPERQGLFPEFTHRKEHDLYSFGVLLFELGFWSRAPELFSKYLALERIKAIKSGMLRRVQHLEPEMGTAFAGATKACLEMDLGVREDDEAKSKLARAFESRVLRKLDPGTRLDD
ncbi:hypothetical protein K491DRAFT_673538 [Lophiostoma macrostomum CBS 122681]|uniref:Peptidase C14 caspase domain-containing protein n=1 Tax=Lophiostoma macrostomum CBS 122681 TaxID=1314788 RepID=A0A6A6TRF7_9PLEO|nr:hypothetical protein K491DRAFT_673538 [Lophiostoma macrostomum CBS 122681]